MTARAFSVATLAKEWACSEGVIRKLIAGGDLGSFRLGALIRIPAEEVRRFECQNLASSDSAVPMLSSGETAKESASDCGYTRPTGLVRRQRQGEAGTSKATVQRGPWAGS